MACSGTDLCGRCVKSKAASGFRSPGACGRWLYSKEASGFRSPGDSLFDCRVDIRVWLLVAEGWARSGKRPGAAQKPCEECWVWNRGRAASWVPFISAEHSAALDQDVAVVVTGVGMVTVFLGAFVRRAVAEGGLDVVQE